MYVLDVIECAMGNEHKPYIFPLDGSCIHKHTPSAQIPYSRIIQVTMLRANFGRIN